MKETSSYRALLLGLATGDAVGVPAEFKSRERLKASPVTDMAGYGSHQQPPGIWSDDSSLTFCLAEMLTGEYDLRKLSTFFINWRDQAWWTARGEVFDIGNATAEAIGRLRKGASPTEAGADGVHQNGNGSLMRILPLAFYLRNQPREARFRITKDVSSLTHRHIRSVLACDYAVEFTILLLNGQSPREAYAALQAGTQTFWAWQSVPVEEIRMYQRLLKQDISLLPEAEIRSTGYVVDTLEASLWCLLTTNSYAEAVLKAVNLGDDTDTTACVTGGLAGLVYGKGGIPPHWLEQLAKRAEIEALADRMAQRLG